MPSADHTDCNRHILPLSLEYVCMFRVVDCDDDDDDDDDHHHHHFTSFAFLVK
jgi:hypothetical protein